MSTAVSSLRAPWTSRLGIQLRGLDPDHALRRGSSGVSRTRGLRVPTGGGVIVIVIFFVIRGHSVTGYPGSAFVFGLVQCLDAAVDGRHTPKRHRNHAYPTTKVSTIVVVHFSVKQGRLSLHLGKTVRRVTGKCIQQARALMKSCEFEKTENK